MNDLWYKPHAEDLLSAVEASGGQLSKSTADAILRVPRHAFLRTVFVKSNEEGTDWLPYNLDYRREHDRRLAYRDESFVVQARNGVPSITCTAPGVIVVSLEALQMRKGMKVLEIGAGTGYSAALMSEIAEDPSLITSVEIDHSFANQAKDNLRAIGLDEIRIVEGDGRLGYEPGGPYEKILVNSTCRHIPTNWLHQLTSGGTLLSIRKDSHTQQLLRLEHKDGLLSGPSLGFAAYPELNRTKDEPVALFDFPDPVVNIPLNAYMEVSREQKAGFDLLNDDDFRFYLQLARPNFHILDMIIEGSKAGDGWRPVIVDAATNETIFFGPIYGDGEHSCESYGDYEALEHFLSVCTEWIDLGRPQLNEFYFTAISPDSRELPFRGQTQNFGSSWHIPSQDPDYLDWIIELKG
ncbi:MAG: methyltransferase [Chloroflexi bacterium]|nr:methyltransferase [Chloroflexota bacterium]